MLHSLRSLDACAFCRAHARPLFGTHRVGITDLCPHVCAVAVSHARAHFFAICPANAATESPAVRSAFAGAVCVTDGRANAHTNPQPDGRANAHTNPQPDCRALSADRRSLGLAVKQTDLAPHGVAVDNRRAD